MSVVRFISDLHLGHNKICEFEGHNRNNCKTVEEHDEWIISQWNSVVTKRDLTWVLGDVAFNKEGLEKVKRLNGVKHLIFGNHDRESLEEYLKVFNKVHGFMKYKNFWLSHAPIHHGSLRNKMNIHGHLHSSEVRDPRYYCVSVEKLQGKPKSIDDLCRLRIELEKINFGRLEGPD